MFDYNAQAKKELYNSILNVYSYRVDQKHALMEVKSFGMAIANRMFNEDSLDNPLELAMCALERKASSLPVPDKQLNALRELAPELVKVRICPECGVWRGHRLNCPL